MKGKKKSPNPKTEETKMTTAKANQERELKTTIIVMRGLQECARKQMESFDGELKNRHWQCRAEGEFYAYRKSIFYFVKSFYAGTRWTKKKIAMLADCAGVIEYRNNRVRVWPDGFITRYEENVPLDTCKKMTATEVVDLFQLN
jgi:hypothetical protein